MRIFKSFQILQHQMDEKFDKGTLPEAKFQPPFKPAAALPLPGQLGGSLVDAQAPGGPTPIIAATPSHASPPGNASFKVQAWRLVLQDTHLCLMASRCLRTRALLVCPGTALA